MCWKWMWEITTSSPTPSVWTLLGSICWPYSGKLQEGKPVWFRKPPPTNCKGRYQILLFICGFTFHSFDVQNVIAAIDWESNTTGRCQRTGWMEVTWRAVMWNWGRGRRAEGKDGYVARERNKHTEIGLWERSLSKGHAEASSWLRLLGRR